MKRFRLNINIFHWDFIPYKESYKDRETEIKEYYFLCFSIETEVYL